MNVTKPVFWSFVLLVAISALYRVIPHEQYGFPPQLAIAVFAGAIMQNKKTSFLLPLLSMVLSDGIFEILYLNGIGNTPGFYSGQWVNYLLLCSLVVFGFGIKQFKWQRILGAAIAAPTAYFILSNGILWSQGGGFGRPLTYSGLIQCYADGLPFYGFQILSTAVFSALFFGCYALLFTRQKKTGITLLG